MIVVGFSLMGSKISMISMKSEMCIQTMNMTRFDIEPAEGDGITQMILGVGQPMVINWIKSQLFSLATAANTAYLISMNRLAALENRETVKFVEEKFLAKSLMGKFVENSERDPILSQYHFILVDLWELISVMRQFIINNDFKIWAYQVSTQVCEAGQIVDIASLCCLGVTVLGLFIAFFMAWSSEFVLRCIVFEEKSSIDMNKFRHDWS